MTAVVRGWFAHRDPSPFLLHDEGERLVEAVHHHWIAYAHAAWIGFLAALSLVLSVLVPTSWGWLYILLGLGTGVWAGCLVLIERKDVFAITTMRVLRVSGLFTKHTATMPMSKVLDISVHRPLLGRLVGAVFGPGQAYGEFVFESAAQDQGLKDIHAVGDPDQRERVIQRVIVQAGLRPTTPYDEALRHEPEGRRESVLRRRRSRPDPTAGPTDADVPAGVGEPPADASWELPPREPEPPPTHQRR